MDPIDAQIRQVFFFDTPDLALNRAAWSSARGGCRARATTRSSSSGRSCRPSCRRSCAGRRLRRRGRRDARRLRLLRLAQGRARRRRRQGGGRRRRPLRKLFSKEQRAFFADARAERLELDDLAVLGPIFVLKLKFAPDGLRRASSSPRCGSTRTSRASSSCRPSACRPRRSRSRGDARLPDRARRRPRAASSRPRRAARWSSSPPHGQLRDPDPQLGVARSSMF